MVTSGTFYVYHATVDMFSYHAAIGAHSLNQLGSIIVSQRMHFNRLESKFQNFISFSKKLHLALITL